MKNINIKLLIFKALLTTVIINLLPDCTTLKEDVLAVVDNRILTVDDFISRYQSSRQKTNFPDNLQVRKEFFENMINEELFIFEAERRGYHQDHAGEWENERLKIQTLLDFYLQKTVFNKIQIQEAELKNLYIRLNTKIKARHLYAGSRRQADSIYTELQQGHSFEAIAKRIFHDPQLRDTGGSLGYFTVDEMDPAFEEVAFALKIGEISQPVRTAQGYSIIQVQDRITKPLLTESEYIKHRVKLENYWRTRKQKIAVQEYVDSLRQALNVTFNTPVIEKLWQFLRRNNSDTLIEKRSYFQIKDSLKDEELVRSKIGIWDIQTFQQYAQFTSEAQHKWIRNQENLEDFIAGLVIRAWILSRAEDLKLAQSDAYKTTVQQKLDDYLLKRMEQTIHESMNMPEDSLQKYYQLNPDKFVIPPKIHLREIVLNNESDAAEVKNRLMNGMSFEKLAKEYSIRRWSADNDGDIGAFTREDLSQYADRLFPLKRNEWTGPVKMDTLDVFFKCVDKYPVQTLSFQEARPQIEESLKPIWQRKARQRLLDSLRTQVKIVTFPEKLKSIRLD